jgi:hypothetical protein
MKTRILAIAAVAALTVAVPASAATNSFSVKLKKEGAAVGKISFKIETNKAGVAAKVTSIKVTGLKTLCLSEEGVEPGSTVTGKLAGTIKIKKLKSSDGKTTYYFDQIGLKVPGFAFAFSGTPNKKGTKVTNGRISGGDVDPQPPSCTHRSDDFTAKRK